jgi:cystathionine beta-lyase
MQHATCPSFPFRNHNAEYRPNRLQPLQQGSKTMSKHLRSPSRFDTAPDRRESDSMKWRKYAGTDILPMWVADMDFPAPPAVLEALHRRIDHGVLGYGLPTESLNEATIDMLQDSCGWSVDPESIVWLPGLVTGLNVACRAMESPYIATAVPIYPPFLSAPEYAGRRVVTTPMVPDACRYVLDMDHMDRILSVNNVRMLLLCNPHNPTGRVFSETELQGILDICERHDVMVCSDEIHCGLILDPDKHHIPIASLSRGAASRTITLMAPSKTYNIPGLYGSFAVISDAGLRKQFIQAMRGIVPRINVLAMTAAEAAFRHGEAWRLELIDYLRENRRIVMEAVSDIPGLSMLHPEATYLAWIDARPMGQEDPAGYFEQFGVGLSDGREFGAPGFLRLNFGCPQSTLATGLARMATAAGVETPR